MLSYVTQQLKQPYLLPNNTNNEGRKITRVLEKAAALSIMSQSQVLQAQKVRLAIALKKLLRISDLPLTYLWYSLVFAHRKAAEAATLSDGAIVGSAVVEIIANNIDEDGTPARYC